MTAKMRAMVIDQFGGAEVFREGEVPLPVLRPGHVLIRVHATSVNPVDCLIREMGPPFGPGLPAVLHGDVAGVIEQVASDVDAFQPGDEVYGCAGGMIGSGGALAEYMLADAALIAHKPKRLSMRDAAALPLVTIAAWEGIQKAGIGAGHTVLVHGGAGGVGHVAVQLIRAAGAMVCATVSSERKAEIARDFGAQATVLYRMEDVPEYVRRLTDGAGFDVVFDTVGGSNLPKSFEAAKLNGAVVTTVALGQFDLSPAHIKGLSLHVVFMCIPLIHGIGRAAHGMILQRAAHLADSGALRPLVDVHEFSIGEVAEAHRLMESGEATGKLILEAAW